MENVSKLGLDLAAGGCGFARQRAGDPIAKPGLEVVDPGGEIPVLQEPMRQIADHERRGLPVGLLVQPIAGFGQSFFLALEQGRREKRRRLSRLFIGGGAARPCVDERLPVGFFLGPCGFGCSPARRGQAFAHDFDRHGAAAKRNALRRLGAGDAVVEGAVEHGEKAAVGAPAARRAGDDQMFARPGHGDVEQALLFLGASQAGLLGDVKTGEILHRTDAQSREARRPIEERFGVGVAPAFDAGLAAGQNDDRELQAFGFVNAHDAHGVQVLFGERALAFVLDVEHALFQLANRFLQRGQAFAAEQLGLLRELLQIRHRLLAVKIAGREQLHRQGCEHVRDRGADGQRAGLFVQARERVVELGQGRREILAEFCRGSVIEQVLAVQLVNLLIGESAQRRAQHADQGQTIVGIFHRAEQIDGIDDFFRGVKVALALDDVANPLAAQRLQVVVNVGELAQQNGHVFRLRAHRFAMRSEDRGLAQDLLFQPARQALAFQTARGLGVDLPVRDDLAHQELGHAARRGASTGRGMNGDVGRLHAVLRLDETFKRAVDAIEDRRVAAKVGGEPAFDAVLRFDDFLDDFEIGFDVGAAKSVDRLLRVPDHEDFSRNDFHLAPIHRGLARLLGQVKKNLILDRIGVLKFVDENRAIAPLEIRAHAHLIAHEIARAHEQAVEGQMPFADKALAEIRGVGNQQAPERAGRFAVDAREAARGADELLSFGGVFGRPALNISMDRFLG